MKNQHRPQKSIAFHNKFSYTISSNKNKNLLLIEKKIRLLLRLSTSVSYIHHSPRKGPGCRRGLFVIQRKQAIYGKSKRNKRLDYNFSNIIYNLSFFGGSLSYGQ